MVILTLGVLFIHLVLLGSEVQGKGPLGAHQNVECLDNNDGQPNVVMQSVVLGKKRSRFVNEPDDVEEYCPTESKITRFVPRSKRLSLVEPNDDVDDKFDKILRAIEAMKMRRRLREDAEWFTNEPVVSRKRGRRRKNYGASEESECLKCIDTTEDEWDDSAESEMPERSFLRRLQCAEEAEEVPAELSRYSVRRRRKKTYGDVTPRDSLYEEHQRCRNRKPAQDILYIPSFERELTSSQLKKKRRLKASR